MTDYLNKIAEKLDKNEELRIMALNTSAELENTVREQKSVLESVDLWQLTNNIIHLSKEYDRNGMHYEADRLLTGYTDILELWFCQLVVDCE